ncbi:MAG TPA: glutamine amidotransferase class-I [Pusillimonas sp.]|jgi:GMP synthase-like glutamine amidotransferase|nr:glutamine amidotransferase class-I [Pusillimonas sp.]HCN71562.1 glutamine amidotransferase class-I [Pusillimonas sp.]|tara:strand:+ start:31865 stop:32587 length:723 start_codon:yes stop_codon:yes gene_type:complete
MKPVAIFQHTEVGAPGTVVPILDDLGVQTRIIRVDQGESVPEDPAAFSGLVLMGGYMGVYDPFPWINQEIELIRRADELDIPVAGHCLGSQILAVALGAEVRKNHRAEIGWQPIQTEKSPLSQAWWQRNPGEELLTFQWHSDTFSLPPDAVRIATNNTCDNQAFVVGDRHIGMQSHFEMTPALVEAYVAKNGAFLKRELDAGNPSVSSNDEMFGNVSEKTTNLTEVLRRIYERWTQGLKH